MAAIAMERRVVRAPLTNDPSTQFFSEINLIASKASKYSYASMLSFLTSPC